MSPRERIKGKGGLRSKGNIESPKAKKKYQKKKRTNTLAVPIRPNRIFKKGKSKNS